MKISIGQAAINGRITINTANVTDVRLDNDSGTIYVSMNTGLNVPIKYSDLGEAIKDFASLNASLSMRQING